MAAGSLFAMKVATKRAKLSLSLPNMIWERLGEREEG